MNILKKTIEDGYNTIEWTKDGVNPSHITKTLIQVDEELVVPSINEQILYENKYQTILLEMGMM